MVWVIDPIARQVMIWTPEAEAVSIDEQGDLVGVEVVPGFRCPFNEIFPPRT
jgi:Uma2 family endonuclease